MTSLALISNIFSGDGLVIFLIAFILVASKRLPPLAKAFAKGFRSALRGFSKSKDEIRHELDAELQNLGYSATRIENRRSVQSHPSASICRRLSVWLFPAPAFQPIS